MESDGQSKLWTCAHAVAWVVVVILFFIGYILPSCLTNQQSKMFSEVIKVSLLIHEWIFDVCSDGGHINRIWQTFLWQASWELNIESVARGQKLKGLGIKMVCANI